MALDFPSNPTNGQVVNFNGKIYEWDGEKWVANTQITKTEIGLSNVANYGVATAGTPSDDVDLQIAGTTVDNKYMTPYKTAYYVENVALKENFTTTILAADTWTDQTGYFTLVKSVSGVTSDMNPIADLDLSSATVNNVQDIQAAFATIYRIETGTDQVTFYAFENPSFPEDTIVTFEVNK